MEKGEEEREEEREREGEREEGEREEEGVGPLEILQYKESPKPTPSRQLSASSPIATIDVREISPIKEVEEEVEEEETRSLDDKEKDSVESDDLDEPSQ